MIKTFKSFILLLLVLFVLDLKAKNGFDTRKLDDYFNQLETNNKAMCGVAIRKGGDLIYDKYIGFASAEKKIPNNESTKFRISSISRVFTVTIIFQLIEEGEISLETRLAEFYPQIPNSKQITISDMLNHRSGLHNFTEDEKKQRYMTSKKTKEEMVKLFASLTPDFKPGSKTEYSNSNYVLLVYIIENITKSTYREELKKRITSELYLKNTYYGREINTKMNEAKSYKFKDEKWVEQPETNISLPHLTGEIVTTPKDLSAFITALFNGKLISLNSLKKMKNIKGGLGKDFTQFTFNDKKAFGYNGAVDGFVSNLAFFPDERIAISLMANGINYDFNSIAIAVLSIYFGLPYEIPKFEGKKTEIPPAELKKYAGNFSSKTLPLKIKLIAQEDQLYGQATGQKSFPLTPFGKREFRFEPAGVVIEFIQDNDGNIDYGSFILKQHGKEYTYTKE
jgi:D-alanyl-D-alanine carboxypeptidase